MAHGQGATSNRRTSAVGTLGRGKRFAKDPNLSKAEKRERDPRRVAAMEETQRHQAALDALMKEQQESPALGATAGALIQARIDKQQENLERAQAEQARIEAESEAPEEAAPITEAPEQAEQDQEDEEPREKSGSDLEPVTLNGKELSESGLPYLMPPVKKLRVRDLPKGGEGNFQFAMMTARMMLRKGYHVKYVLEFTGLGYEDVRDIPLDAEGYGKIPGQEEDNELIDS